MTITVDATWEGGVLRPDRPLDLPERARVHVVVESPADSKTALGVRLRKLRAEIMADARTPVLDSWERVEQELRGVRGGQDEER